MNIQKTTLEEVCKFLLQKNISLEFNNKIFKQGRLILFSQKNFYLTFLLNNSKKKDDKIEIPIPYDIESHMDENLIYFDYRIKTLAKFAPEVENYLKIYNSNSSKNKFWDTILTINSNYE